MTDVRDREVELDGRDLEIEVKEFEPELPRRRSLAARAFSPLRRPTSRALVPVAPALDLRSTPDLDTEPQQKSKYIIIPTLLIVVLAPIVASGVYLFVFASDQYVAETRFAVRKASAGADGVEGGSGGGVSMNSLMTGSATMASQDAEIVASYIHSRGAIDDISRTLNVREIYQRPEADFWARLKSDATAEDLDEYWNKMVSVYIEASSGIVQVSVSAFRREDALALTKAILASSEHLANSLSLKMQADQTKLAEDEVRRTEGSVRFALADLTTFRNSQHLIDPVETSQSTGKLLMQLLSDKIEAEGQLFVVQRTQGPNAPGIGSVKARLESINNHVTELQNQLAGNKDVAKNMAATMSRFEELELKKEFSEKMFDFARQGLERARLAAMGQSIYLAVFVPPSLPQDYTYPERYVDLFMAALAAVMTWISGATITASVLDHRL